MSDPGDKRCRACKRRGTSGGCPRCNPSLDAADGHHGTTPRKQYCCGLCGEEVWAESCIPAPHLCAKCDNERSAGRSWREAPRKYRGLSRAHTAIAFGLAHAHLSSGLNNAVHVHPNPHKRRRR